jgi:1-acyl-sn-glycerol-3-phosphate acyltransferase
LAYRTVIAVGRPIMSWSRLTVTGLANLPATGPALVVGDHDSYWDPIAIAVAARQVRHIRALAKSTLWKNKAMARCMDSMGHIPVERGASNEAALQTAIAELADGACIGIFPEATRSLGKNLPAKSGVGRMAAAVPEATVVLVRTNGSTDVVRLPKRPSITVEFLLPAGGQWQPGESVSAFADRLLAELRTGAPVEVPGRKRTAARYRSRVEPS